MRVLVACIASSGEPYNAMKRVVNNHAASAPAGVDVVYLHGEGAIEEVTDRDRAYPVEEGLGRGVTRKTLCAFKDAIAEGYDYVVRSNLSTWFDWDKMMAWLNTAPRAGLAAGTSDKNCGFWLCGCCIVLSIDVVRDIVDKHWSALWDDVELDDIVLSRALLDIVPAFVEIPRIDIYHRQYPGLCVHQGDMPLTKAVAEAFVFRVKSADRHADVRILHLLSCFWNAQDRPEALLLVHMAQCTALC